MGEYRDKLTSVYVDIEDKLKGLIQSSPVLSEHMSPQRALKVKVYDYTELINLNGELTFLDCNGLHYSLTTDCDWDDLVDIIEESESRQQFHYKQMRLLSDLEDKADEFKEDLPRLVDKVIQKGGVDLDSWSSMQDSEPVTIALFKVMMRLHSNSLSISKQDEQDNEDALVRLSKY